MCPFLSCFNSESCKEFELTLFLVSLLCYLLDNNWFRLFKFLFTKGEDFECD